MNTHKYVLARNLKPILGLLSAILFSGISSAKATISPYFVDASGIQQYALVEDLRHGGNFNVNNSQVNGNTAVLGSSGAYGANNDVFNGNFSYTGSSFSLYSTVSVTGTKSQSFTLASTVQNAADFSKTIAGFTPTQSFGQNDNVQYLNGDGGINVIDINGGNVNGTVTLHGGSNDVFYINVMANMAMNGVALTGGVTADHVFWNIINGQNANLSGSLNGTFLAFNSGGSATQINVNQANINGSVYSGGIDASNDTFNVVAGAATSNAMANAPEPSTVAGMVAFAVILLGSPMTKFLKRSRVV